MSNVIIRKQEDLPEDLKYLTGKNFDPANSKDVLYVRNSYFIKGLARIPYVMTLSLSILFGVVFLYTLIAELISSSSSQFYSEGTYITFILFIFIFIFFLICRRYYKKSIDLQQMIDKGEMKFGLWITPDHIINRDHNGGLYCIRKKDIDHSDIYISGRPRLDMVALRLKNKQNFYVVSNWLEGFSGKPEELKLLIDQHVFF
ncbi:hypothetical protein BH10BAC5_BH10BAC5_19570 [soil metagenome]